MPNGTLLAFLALSGCLFLCLSGCSARLSNTVMKACETEMFAPSFVKVLWLGPLKNGCLFGPILSYAEVRAEAYSTQRIDLLRCNLQNFRSELQNSFELMPQLLSGEVILSVRLCINAPF